MSIGPWALNGFDIAVLLVCVISLVMAASRGVVREVISIIALLAGIVATLVIWGQFRVAAQDFISPAWLADGILGAGAFFLVYSIVVFFLSRFTTKDTKVGFLNRILGGGFGAARGLVIAALVTMLLNSSYRDKLEMAEQYGAPTPELSTMLENSSIYPTLDRIGTFIRSLPFSRLKSVANDLKDGDIEGAIEELRELTQNNPSCLIDPDADKIREECGVFGIFGMENAASLTALGLHALQHRGQEACGIASYDGTRFHTERHLGLVGDNFTGSDPSERLKGHVSIGHVRYSTAGQTTLRNVQPLFSELSIGGFAVAHNGHLTNAYTLRERLVEKGAIFQSTSDTEVLIHLIARARKGEFIDRFMGAIRQVDGGYAFVCMTSETLLGARDRFGIRPLLIGRIGDSYILASETCAFDMVGAEFIREVAPGEVVAINADGIRSFRAFPDATPRPCIFEFVYFARPDSIVGGKSVYEVRKRMGQRLAQESPADVDVIIPVPDSGVPAAIGFSQELGVPFELGIIRNHYVGRTFIQPTQQIRDMGVRLKHSANRAMIEGKRVLLVDDSIVRGTTSTKIVRMIKAAGAKEVHFRSASPPIRFPDHYGIDMPTKEKLIAANYSLADMTEMLEVDSLGFLSVEGLYWAMGEECRADDAPQYTDHCFTGDYPTPLIDRDRQMGSAHQLSFLVEVA